MVRKVMFAFGLLAVLGFGISSQAADKNPSVAPPPGNAAIIAVNGENALNLGSSVDSKNSPDVIDDTGNQVASLANAVNPAINSAVDLKNSPHTAIASLAKGNAVVNGAPSIPLNAAGNNGAQFKITEVVSTAAGDTSILLV